MAQHSTGAPVSTERPAHRAIAADLPTEPLPASQEVVAVAPAPVPLVSIDTNVSWGSIVKLFFAVLLFIVVGCGLFLLSLALLAFPGDDHRTRNYRVRHW